MKILKYNAGRVEDPSKPVKLRKPKARASAQKEP